MLQILNKFRELANISRKGCECDSKSIAVLMVEIGVEDQARGTRLQKTERVPSPRSADLRKDAGMATVAG